MLVTMKAISVNELDDYIDNSEVPFAICTPPYGVTSNRQQRFLEKYYDKVVDKRGWVSYYCNIINMKKCRASGFDKIKFADGRVENIKDYRVVRNSKLRNGFVVAPRFSSGSRIDALSLVKQIRLEVEKVKTQVNAIAR